MYAPPERVITQDEKRQDRMQRKEKRKQRGMGFGNILYFPYPSGIIYGHRPPEHMIGWKVREKEVEELTERGRVRGK